MRNETPATSTRTRDACLSNMPDRARVEIAGAALMEEKMTVRTNFLHATRHGWSMQPRHRIVTPSRFGYTVKLFIACDDGSRICSECLGEIDGNRNQYGPVQKYGECYNCGLKVERY